MSSGKQHFRQLEGLARPAWTPGDEAVVLCVQEASARAQKKAFTPRRWARFRLDR